MVAGAPLIRFGLGTVKNVGAGAAEGIVAARAEGGPFAHIEDFTKRVDLRALNRRALESLIKSGALDPLGSRGPMLAGLDRIVSLAQREAKLKETGQSTMFDMFGDTVATPLPALTTPLAGGKTIGDYIDSWAAFSGAGQTTSTADGRAATARVPAALTLSTVPLRKLTDGSLDPESAVTVRVGHAQCSATDRRS